MVELLLQESLAEEFGLRCCILTLGIYRVEGCTKQSRILLRALNPLGQIYRLAIGESTVGVLVDEEVDIYIQICHSRTNCRK